METALEISKNGVAKIPTMAELINNSEADLKQNALMVILNQEPPAQWLLTHPMTKGQYLPIQRVEYLLSRIYGKWWVEVKDVRVLANSTVVTVRLFVKNPITGETEWNDGVGACPIQTDKGAGAMDWNATKADGVMKSAPAAKSYAIKDAAECFGKLFGKDLSRKEQISYNELLKVSNTVDFDDLQTLFELKREALNKTQLKNAERIINNKEVNSYKKLQEQLNSL